MHTNISINNGKTKLHTRVCRHKFRNFSNFCLHTRACRQKFLWIFWQHTWGCFYNCCHYYYHKKCVYVYSFDNWFYNLLPDIHVEPAMSVSCLRELRTLNKGKLHDLVNSPLIRIISFISNVKNGIISANKGK
jgi:hypothetical protein